MGTDLKNLINKNMQAYAQASEDDKLAYDHYVENCHSNINEWIQEFNFKEWVEAGKPSGSK